ncbi:Uma2 family endonuclease [Planctomicrobium piriforme]|uniref:Uma2 family endonuclease n=1 Tax=Planctomicrobium piriforme TaxID=1576369 RepID=UPI0036F29C2C
MKDQCFWARSTISTNGLAPPVSLDEFLELERNAPDDVYLELIRGEIREKTRVTTGSPKHAEAIPRISCALLNWLNDQPHFIGTVAGGEARCRLNLDAETIVGLDVACFHGEHHVTRPNDQAYFDGPPVLAVEVLSATDTFEAISDRIRLFLSAGVKQVWIADPDFQTVTVYRSDNEPVLYARSEILPGDPELPEFHCNVSQLFGRA